MTSVLEPVGKAFDLQVETITPDVAIEWLANAGTNRKLSERRVDAFAAAMNRGEWRFTGDAIKFDENGQVRDGQHRLRAIIKSDVPIQTLVVRGLDSQSFDVMDVGRARTPGDVLWMHGYASQNAVAGAARLLMMMERFGRFVPTVREAQTIASTVSILNYTEEHQDIINGIRLADRLKKIKLMGGSATWGALFTLFLRIDTEAAYQFAHYLATGESMPAGHPILLLRNRLMWHAEGERAKSPADREMLAALAIKAWNSWRKGQTRQQLYWRGDGPKAEDFPTPI